MVFRAKSLRAGIALAVALAARSSLADVLAWTGNVSNVLGTAGNWSPAHAPLDGDLLVFSNAGAAGSVLSLKSSLSFLSLVFNGTTSFDISTTNLQVLGLLEGSTVSILTSASQTLSGISVIGSTATFNLQGDLNLGQFDSNHPATVTLTGIGTLRLSGNTLSASFVVDHGNLLLSNGSSVRGLNLLNGTVTLAGTGGNQIADTGTLGLTAGLLDMNGRSETVFALRGTGGTITNSAAGTVSTLKVQGNTPSFFSGVLQDGPGTLALALAAYFMAPSSLSLSNSNNSFSGGISISAGRLIVGNSSALGPGPISVPGSATLIFTGDVSIPNNMLMGSSAHLDIGGPGAVVLEKSLPGTGSSLTYFGSNTLTLAVSNPYTGLYSVLAGALRLAPLANESAAAAINIAPNAQVIFDSSSAGGTTVRAVNLKLDAGAKLTLLGSPSAATVDRVEGPITAAGEVVLDVTGAGQVTTLSAQQLAASANSFVHFITHAGTAGSDTKFLFDSAPTLTGAGSDSTASNASIMPRAVVNDAGFASYDANGIVMAGSTPSIADADIVGAVNFRGDAAGMTIAHPTSVNSFFNSGLPGTLTLSDTLTIATAFGSTHDLGIIGSGALSFPSGEAVLFNGGGRTNLDVPVQSAAITFFGNGSGTIVLGTPGYLVGSVSVGNVELASRNATALQNAAVTMLGGSSSRLTVPELTSQTIGSLAGVGEVPLQNASGSAVILFVGGNNASTEFAGTFTGPGSVRKVGTGSLTLSGNSSFGGGLTVASGALIANNTAALGTGAVTLAGGTLALSGLAALHSPFAAYPNPLVVSPGVSYLTGTHGQNVWSILNGPITGSGTLVLSGLNDTSAHDSTLINFAGDLSGFTGTIQFDISANSSNYWFGPEYDLSGQPFLADLSHARVVLSGQGKSSAPLDPRLGAGDGVYGTVRIGELSGTGGILRGGFNAQGPLLFEVGALNTNSTFGGRIANYDGGGVVSLTKVGSGILSLAGSGNDFTGATTINAGILEVAPGGSFGAGTVTIANSAVLSFLGSSFALPRVAGTGTIFLNSATLTLGNSSISSFAGAITGSGTLLKNGTLTLSGNSTYTGTTLVNSSLLIVASSGALGASTLTLNRAPVNNPAKVQLNDGINVPNNIILNDSSSQFGNAIIDLASNARATLSGNISATGTSNQYRIGSTNGTLTLTGASTAGTPTNAVAGTTFWNNGSSNLTNQPSSKVVFAGTASLTSWQTPIGIHASNVLLQDNASFTVAGTVSAAGFYMGMGAFFSNYQGPTILTLQDNAVINLGARTFDLQNNPSYSNSTVNLNGGSLVLGRFIRSFNGTGFLSGTINFNGTMIVAAQNATSFLPSFTSTIQTAIVKTGGARINPNNFAITALLPLIHDPALGAAADGGLLVAGAGTLVLASANTYTGPTTISAGVLQLGTGGTIGSFASGTVLNNGTLAFNRSNALTLNNSISGTGGLSQIGPGTTTLAGGYTATGPINVSAGKLLFAETSGLRQTSAVLLASAGVNVANTNSVLDLTNHDLMITYNNASSSSYIINTLWENGTALLLGAGDPSGPRITSSTANNNTSSFPTFIVAFDIDSLFGGGISGDGSGVGSNYGSYTDNLVVTQPGTIMFKYGYYADIDFSGKVDAGDINLVLGSLGQTTPGLADPGLSYLLGDVDYSGKVDAGDINLVLGMLGAGNGTTGGNPLGIIESSAVAGVAWNVPEPATLVLLTLGALIVVPRPRRGR